MTSVAFACSDAAGDPHAAYPQTVSTTREIPAGRLLLVRHGMTEWAKSGQHTGLTDLPLLPEGEAAATASAPMLDEFEIVSAFVSPLQRARRTAELIGVTSPRVDPDLVEWDYGGYEGLTTPQVRERSGDPDWTVWNSGVLPGDTPGETIEQVAARARAVIDRAAPDLHRGDVVLIGHGQMLRILASVWLRTDLRFGAQLPFDAGSLSVLGYEREAPAIRRWNMPAAAPVAH